MPKRVAISAAAPERPACPATPSNSPIADSITSMASGPAAERSVSAMWPGDIAQLSILAQSPPPAAP